MSSILDIDLDYFNLVEHPLERLNRLLSWASSPVNFIVDKHNDAVTRWKRRIERGTLQRPLHILHVDEHHDMMDEGNRCNIANCMYHAMRIWPECRVHWLVEDLIDSPAMWLSDKVWESLSGRFSMSSHIPRGWPKANFVSVCTSPEFVDDHLRKPLEHAILCSMSGQRKNTRQRQ